MNKRPWKTPVVKSIDSCEPVFGDCQAGSSPVTGDGTKQCQAGSGASHSGACVTGTGAKTACSTGNGVK